MSRRVRNSEAVSPVSNGAEGTISRFSVLPLRVFLGVTFIYAAWQKVTDPGFFHAGSPTYIGAQILAFSRGSPIKGLLHHLMQFAVAVGALTVFTEACIGALVLVGLFTRPAALVGMALSTGFFLSASWGTYPYFFGSDIVFVVCWLTIALSGPGAFALDSIVESRIVRMLTAQTSTRVPMLLFVLVTGYKQPQSTGGTAPSLVTAPGRALLSRGEALAGALVTLGFIALGLHPRPSSSGNSSSTLAGKAATTVSGSTPTPGSTNVKSAIPAGAKKIGNISQLPINSAGTVSDPKTGDPAVIIHGADSKFYAYDAVCTHAGCTVQYDSQNKVLACPCHGGMFDPIHGAQVVGGPPPSPLAPVDMAIDAHGDIYIV